MASKQAIFAALTALDLAGLNPPPGWRSSAGEPTEAVAERRRPVLAVWHDALAEHNDEAVALAVRAYVQRPISAWPSVGDILGLIEGASHDGDAALAFGRLRELARRHAADDPPLRPEERGPWVLDDDPQIAAWMTRAAAGTSWPLLRAAALDGSGRTTWLDRLRAAVEASCKTAAAWAAEPTGPRHDAGARVLDLAERTDAASLWRSLASAAVQHEDDDPPTERATGWRLDADPDVERRMWAGLVALGGWRAFCALPFGDPDDGAKTIASTRKAFAEAYTAAVHHDRREPLRLLRHPDLALADRMTMEPR